MAAVKLVVGLGNPGAKYAGTRHNVGFDVVDILAARWNLTLTVEKFHGWFAQGRYGDEQVVLLKPTTFMNRCGRAVSAAGRFYKLEPSDLLVIADDFALPLGRLRVRMKGSAGSHNGLQSVIDHMGGEAWCRLRIGIGEPVGVPSVHVLTRFGDDELSVMADARLRAAEAVMSWIEHGPELTMTRYNGDAA